MFKLTYICEVSIILHVYFRITKFSLKKKYGFYKKKKFRDSLINVLLPIAYLQVFETLKQFWGDFKINTFYLLLFWNYDEKVSDRVEIL